MVFFKWEILKPTRWSRKLVIPYVNTTTYGLHSFRYASANIWNKLTEDLTSLTSLNEFRTKICQISFEQHCNCYFYYQYYFIYLFVIYLFIHLFIFLGEISYRATLVNPRWNKKDDVCTCTLRFVMACARYFCFATLLHNITLQCMSRATVHQVVSYALRSVR